MIPINIPRPIEDFSKSNLSGRKRNWIVVSNNSDPRIMDFDFMSTVFCNWPSQQHRKYPEGFIQFNNSRKFDRQRRTIYGVPKFLFWYRDVKIYWERYIETKKIREALNVSKDEDFYAAAELIIQPVDPTFVVNRIWTFRAWIEAEVGRCLPAIGLPQLRELAALLTMAVPEGKALNVAA